MGDEYKNLSNMLIRGEINSQEFIERIDAIKQDIFMSLADKFMEGKISEMEYVERYNRLIDKEPQPFGPPELHEHI